MPKNMKLRFPETAIESWAQKYEYPREETSLLALRPDIQKAGYITKEQLGLVARWKAPRSAGHIEGNTEDYVKEITSWSFASKEERSRIEVLTLDRPVHPPATWIPKWMPSTHNSCRTAEIPSRFSPLHFLFPPLKEGF